MEIIVGSKTEKIPNYPHHLHFHEKNIREEIDLTKKTTLDQATGNGNQLTNNNRQFSEKAVHLRVLDLNTWGLSWPFSKDRDARFRQGDLTTGGASIRFVLILRLPYDYFYGALIFWK